MLECILAMDIDSTMELPSEPDPGFAGSSSCVRNTWEHMGVCSALGELQLQCSYPMSAAYPRPAASVASDRRAREFPCKTHRQTALNALESRTVPLSRVHLVLAISVTAMVTFSSPVLHGTHERGRFGPVNVQKPPPQNIFGGSYGTSNLASRVVTAGPS